MGSNSVRWIWVMLAAMASISAAPGAASDYPNRPVRFVVPYPPGGNTDVFSRMIGTRLGERLGQQFVMDNRPGAAGTLGVELAARAAGDGYTLVMGSFGSIIVARALNPRLKYDPIADFSPVCSVASPPGLLVVHPGVPVRSLRDLVSYAKANPRKLNYATPGSGAWNHLFFELLKQRAGIDLVHVPYKGIGPAMNEFLGGHVQAMMAPVPSSLQHVRAGRLRALATTSDVRSQLVPDIPTIAESGVPGYRAAAWFAVLAPARTAPAIITRLNAEIVRILDTQEMRAALAQEGADPAPAAPEEVAKYIREQIDLWAPIVKSLGLAQETT